MLDGELVERHVLLEGVDHPVPPAPHITGAVTLVAIGVGIARGFEPTNRHPLGVPGATQQTVDRLFVGVGVRVGQEVTRLGRGGGQAGKVKRDATQQGAAVGLGHRLQTLAIKPGSNEMINGMAAGYWRALRRNERVMRLVGGTFFDPAPDQSNLVVRKTVVPSVGGGHALALVGGRDALVDAAFGRVAGHDAVPAFAQIGFGVGFAIQAQRTLAVTLVRPVAGKAAVRQQGPDLTIELNARRLFSGQRDREKKSG